MNSREMKVTMYDIAAITGQSTDVVWRNARDGWFCLDDKESVFKYVSGHILLNLIDPRKSRVQE